MAANAIVISEFMDPGAVAGLAAEFAVLYDPELVDQPDRLAAEAAAAQALIVRNRTQVNAALLDLCPALRVVGRLGVGLDNIDLDACRRRGVRVFPATGANTVAVAEQVIGALLVLRRGVFAASHEVAAGRWPRQRLIGREANGARLGLVGFGAIAQAVARRAQALEMRIGAYDPLLPPGQPAGWPELRRFDTLDELLAVSDVLSLHVPLTDQTRNLIDAAALAQLPAGAVLINTARGGVVNENALADALLDGRLGGALLDVFQHEPLAAGSKLAVVLEHRPQALILTPHVAGVTEESNVRVSELTAAQVGQALRAPS